MALRKFLLRPWALRSLCLASRPVLGSNVRHGTAMPQEFPSDVVRITRRYHSGRSMAIV